MNNKLKVIKKLDLTSFDEYVIIDDIIYTVKDNIYTLYDIAGNKITKKNYQYIGGYNSDVFIVMYDDKYTIIDKEGNEVIYETYDYISDFKNNVAIVKREKRYGLINKRGDLLIPVNFYDIKFLDNGLIAVKKRNLNRRKSTNFNKQDIICYEDLINKFKYHLYDKSGLQISDKYYDEVISCNDSFCIVKLNNKFGLINKTAEEVIKIKYDDFSFNDKGVMFYLKNKCYFLEISDINIIDILNEEVTRMHNKENIIIFKDSVQEININKNKISK